MSETLTQPHSWVKYTRNPVSAVPDPDNDAEVFVIEELTPEQAEEGAVYGCEACGVEMEGNTDTLCDPMCHCGVNLSEHNTDPHHDFVRMS